MNWGMIAAGCFAAAAICDAVNFPLWPCFVLISIAHAMAFRSKKKTTAEVH